MAEQGAIQPGDRVGIPRGSMILSDFRPNAPVCPYPTTRDQAVVVNHTSSRETRGMPIQTVRWAGAGGYWREVAAADVEKL